MIKKMLLTAIATISIFSNLFNVSRETYNPNYTYSQTMAVIDCKYLSNETTEVTLINCNGYIYQCIENTWDIYPEEYYSVIMYNNKTELVYDDEILKINYDRIDMLENQLSQFECCAKNHYINNN